MKSVFLVMFLTMSAFAQSPTPVPAACGPDKTTFDVKTEESQGPPAQPDAGKALVYFIHDDGPMGNHQHETLRIGVDGTWVGAYKHNSYLSVFLEPGEHHVCAKLQPYGPELTALAHFTAEPGKVYYFRTQFLAGMTTLYPTPPHLDLDQPDSDQAKYLIASFPRSVSTAKK